MATPRQALQTSPSLADAAVIDAVPLWQLGIVEVTGHNLETRGREEVNRLLALGWQLLQRGGHLARTSHGHPRQDRASRLSQDSAENTSSRRYPSRPDVTASLGVIESHSQDRASFACGGAQPSPFEFAFRAFQPVMHDIALRDPAHCPVQAQMA